LAAAESESELESHLRSLRDRYGPPPVQLDNLAYSLRVKIAGERLGLRAVEATGSRIAVRVDPDRELDVDGLASGYSGRIRVLPNRLLLETSPERWQADLLVLLERLEDSYSRERATTGA
jgi:transcription-repair coupling factor (superfamily II helicase)